MCQKSYELLRSRGRNAWTLPSCLSTKPQPEIVEFDSAGLLGGIINENIEKKPGDGGGSGNRETLKMQCVPLYSVLLALGKYYSIYRTRAIITRGLYIFTHFFIYVL